MKIILLSVCCLLLAGTFVSQAAVSISEQGGWFESVYATWPNSEAYSSYHVYVCPEGGQFTPIDDALVRNYGTYGRADVLGLKAGQYQLKVVPVADNVEVVADAATTDMLTATAYDRSGFAHFKTASGTFNPAKGVGAYQNDGTLKPGAKVFYICADNVKTIKTTVKNGSKDTNVAEYTGMQSIIDAYQKGYDTTPLCFRILGTIKATDMDALLSSAEGLQIKGRNSYSELNITIEGVGRDATIHGFGFLLRNACSVELRNFGIMWFMDDAVSMDTDNSNLWIHNLDLFYGQPGGDSDQKKGDGTLDIKGDSKFTTIAYNHLWDSGKSSLCGMSGESGPNYITYHHNWFDHSDSRHPRIRTMSVHIYNNYFDGNSKYGVGVTNGADAFVEANYFRNCKYPMLISKQGSDVHNGIGSSDDVKGTFSGEDGGSIKAYANYMTGQIGFQPYQEGHATYATHFDAYVVSTRDEKVPSSVVALQGNDTYSNFDTDPATMYTNYTTHKAEDVPAIVKGVMGAGRCQHGDFSWTFSNGEDGSDAIIEALSTAVRNYQPTLIGFYGVSIGNNGTSQPDDDPDNDDDDIKDNTPNEDGYIDVIADMHPSDDAIYYFSVTRTVPAAIKNGVAQNYSDTLLTVGGRALYGNITKLETATFAAGGFGFKLDGEAKSDNTKYVLCLLDEPLQTGDQITITGFATSNATETSIRGINVYADQSKAAVASIAYIGSKNTELSATITVGDTMAGLTSLYLARNTQSTYFTALEVCRSTDGIHTIATTANSDGWFDLMGRQVDTPRPGQIYLHGGKRVLMR